MRYAIQRCCCCIKKLNCYNAQASLVVYSANQKGSSVADKCPGRRCFRPLSWAYAGISPTETTEEPYNFIHGDHRIGGIQDDAATQSFTFRRGPRAHARPLMEELPRPAHHRLRPRSRLGLPHVLGRSRQLHHVERPTRAWHRVHRVDRRPVRDAVRQRVSGQAPRSARETMAIPAAGARPHDGRNAAHLLQDVYKRQLER